MLMYLRLANKRTDVACYTLLQSLPKPGGSAEGMRHHSAGLARWLGMIWDQELVYCKADSARLS